MYAEGSLGNWLGTLEKDCCCIRGPGGVIVCGGKEYVNWECAIAVLVVEPDASEMVGLAGHDFGGFEETDPKVWARSMALGMVAGLHEPFLILGEAGFPVKLVSSNVRHLKSFLYPPQSTLLFWQCRQKGFVSSHFSRFALQVTQPGVN